jgi:hypothetical protein
VLLGAWPVRLAAQADPAPLITRAARALAVEDFDAAVAIADSAAALGSQLSSVQLILGQAYLSHARAFPSLGAIGKVKRGRAAVERAIALDPDNLEARSTLMQFLLQAPGIVGGSRDGARAQAREIERRDRPRGLLARLEVATAGRKKDEILGVYTDALPLLAAAGDTSALLARSLITAADKLKDGELRRDLRARVYAAVPDRVGRTP